MSKVLITGGTGAIGRQLIARLLSIQWQVNVVGRSQYSDLPEGCNYYMWDLAKMEMPQESIEGVTHLVHLAGAGIAEERWSDRRKVEIRDSRVTPILLISKTLREAGIKLDCVVSASGVGYYGAITNSNIYRETNQAHGDFLGRTCHAWENSISYLSDSTTREVRLRTGVVLMNGKGALQKLQLPAKFGLGSALGSGKQWVPWIHIDDLVQLYEKALSDSGLSGPINAVAPDFITQANLSRTINKVLSRPNILPNVPRALLKMSLGEMSELILEGSRVSPERLLKTGFKFRFGELELALRNLLK
jgi:uncharacterized protein (TIGR01777 family)